MKYKDFFSTQVCRYQQGEKTYFNMADVCLIAQRDMKYQEEMKPHMSDMIEAEGKLWVDYTDVRILFRDAGTKTAQKYLEALFGRAIEKAQSKLN